MPGPPPNPDRVRRAAPARGEFRSAPAPSWPHAAFPPPPDGLTPASITAWRTWGAAWFAAWWTPADLPALRVLIQLHDQVERGDFVRSTELRRWMDSFGITPKGQQSLRWRPPNPTELPATRDRPTYAHLHADIPKTDPA